MLTAQCFWNDWLLHPLNEYKIFLDGDGNRLFSLPQLVSDVINAFGKKIYNNVPTDGTRIGTRLVFNGEFQPSIYCKGKDGHIHKIGNVEIKTKLFLDRQQFPLQLSKYKNVDSEESIAELATADCDVLGKKYRFEIIAPNAGECLKEGTVVAFHSIPIDNSDDETV
jgi:hypothetical protein